MGEEIAKSIKFAVQIIYSVKGSLMVIFFKTQLDKWNKRISNRLHKCFELLSENFINVTKATVKFSKFFLF